MWCRSSLSGRADALYVVNDALGSFLLRASEVIDQVRMSACGRFCCRNRHADGAGRLVHFLKPSIVTRWIVRATYARLY
jgi:hypothetical protein